MTPEPEPSRAYSVPAASQQATEEAEPMHDASPEPQTEGRDGGDGPPSDLAQTYKRKRKEIHRVTIAIGIFLLVYQLFGFKWILPKKVLDIDVPVGEGADELPLILLCVLLAHLTGLMAEGARMLRALGGNISLELQPTDGVGAVTSRKDTSESQLIETTPRWFRCLYWITRFFDLLLANLIFCAVVACALWVAIHSILKVGMSPVLHWVSVSFLLLAAMRLSQFLLLIGLVLLEKELVHKMLNGIALSLLAIFVILLCLLLMLGPLRDLLRLVTK